MILVELPPALRSVLAIAPIALFLGGLVALSWSARRASIVSCLVAVAEGVLIFGMDLSGLTVASIKGVLLSLFVLLVVWAALLLYSLVDRLGAVEAIGLAMTRSTGIPSIRALIMAWGFSGFLQGIAGFGAPVASVVPLLKVAGFGPARSVAAAMVGHSWAITFGSMGSSFFAISLVTRIPGEELAPWIAALFVVPIIVTGIAVLHILLGWEGVRRGAPAALGAGLVIGAAMFAVASLGAGAIASTVPALIGCALLWLIGRRSPPEESIDRVAKLGFHTAFLPYYLLIGITLATQVGPLSSVVKGLTLGFDLPQTVTSLGYLVPAERAYPSFRVLAHPATVIAIAILGMSLVYRWAGIWPDGTLRAALLVTYRRSTASSTAVLFMVLMALVMADSGMTRALAEGIRTVSGPLFPLLSPFLGVLGAVMTGSNTNSNVTMGLLQVQTAVALGVAPVLIAAAQTVGGSLGAGVSPDKAVIGASVAGIQGQEAEISRLALPYALLATALVGAEIIVLAMFHAS